MSWIIDIFQTAASPDVVIAIGDCLGVSLDQATVTLMLPLFQFVLIWLPVFLGVLVLRFICRVAVITASSVRQLNLDVQSGSVIPPGLIAYILKFSARQQIALILLGLTSLPLLYASLELPKIIINHVITPTGESTTFPMVHFGTKLDRIDHLVILCVLLLLVIVSNGVVKFHLNLRSGQLAERLLRRLRLTVYRQWLQRRPEARRTDVIPMIAQEVEPIGGFGGDVIAQPVFQGGTFLVIVIFMFIQNPILGLAALSLLPLQLVLIPYFQRRINSLARRRISEIRRLGEILGEQAISGHRKSGRPVRAFRELEKIRWALFRWKFSMKALNNFLTALTPFFFYAVGGYLVIRGELSLGALVAVLAAFKDFSNPLRELFRYYQRLEDVRVRYRELSLFCGVIPPQSAASPPVSQPLRLPQTI